MRKFLREIKSDISIDVKTSWRHSSRLFKDIIFPPHPLWPHTYDHISSKDMSGQLNFIDQPQCYQCGYPFAYDTGERSLCAGCLTTPPLYDRARAALQYDAYSRGPILAFKHGGQTYGLDIFARQLMRAGRVVLAEADYLIPVPLHSKRLRHRRFNQAALLARRLSHHCDVPCEYGVLKRIKATDSQGGKTATGRIRNVRGAFHVLPDMLERIKGQRLVLIDDVMTTGATVNACAKILKANGAKSVDVLTLARVLKDEAL